MRFSNNFLDEIRDRVPISSVIGPRLSWDRRKTNAQRGDYWACCPFHGEKSPSFHCEDKKGRYHCFGCGASGDHFRFLTEATGASFPEAVEQVAALAGVPMPARDAEAEARDKQRASLTDAMELATKFFQDQLQSAAGAKARAYLRERGLSSATQQAFRLGYAPDSRNALKEHLASKGIAKEQIEACGLVRHGDDIPVSYDWFRDRIMFPIEDTRSRVIAFGGRALSADAPAKYMNSPETELFHKGEMLFNHARARKAVGKDGTVIAVEGYMDAIALSQAGFDNVVAPLGTALTESQIELLWRMAGEPVLCFDGDQAGLRAAYRAADLALPSIGPGRSVRFALLPDGQDPDDLVKSAGPAAFAAVLNQARPLADLIWMRETASGLFDTPERRADLEKTLRELTSRIRDETVRRHYSQDMDQRVAAAFGMRRRADSERGGPAGRGGWPARAGGQGRFAATEGLARSAIVTQSSSAMPLREAALVAMLVNHPALIDRNFETVAALELEQADLARCHRAIVDAASARHGLTRDELAEALAAPALSATVERAVALARRARLWPALEDAAFEDAEQAFQQALALTQRVGELRGQRAALETALADAVERDEERRSTVFLSELGQVTADIAALEQQDALIEGFGVLSGRARLRG